ncbi:MAG TPA: hypothetical protein VD789_12835, partial [Thermomicrobiales bacterium]|nr:hypothetical protein [Thermomicrobiales bacterium]
MRWRPPSLSFHTRLTLTIAGAFIGAMAIILVLGLFAARNFDIGVVSTSLMRSGESMTPPGPDLPDPVPPPEPVPPPDSDLPDPAGDS